MTNFQTLMRRTVRRAERLAEAEVAGTAVPAELRQAYRSVSYSMCAMASRVEPRLVELARLQARIEQLQEEATDLAQQATAEITRFDALYETVFPDHLAMEVEIESLLPPPGVTSLKG